MATPFQIAWTFLKSLPYDNDKHRAIVEGGTYRNIGGRHGNIPVGPEITVPSYDDAQDNYALDESFNGQEEPQHRDDGKPKPLSEEEMYAAFTQSQVPQDEDWDNNTDEQKEDWISPDDSQIREYRLANALRQQ